MAACLLSWQRESLCLTICNKETAVASHALSIKTQHYNSLPPAHTLLSKWLLVVLLITMLVKRDVENASASLAGFNTSCSPVLISVLVSTMCSVSLVDGPSISLGDQARVTKGVLNEREVLP